MSRRTTIPACLLLAAVGLAAPWFPQRSTLPRVVQGIGIAAMLLALLVSGPFSTAEFRHSQFTHQSRFMKFTSLHKPIPAEVVPRFYRDLGAAADRPDETTWCWTPGG